MCEKGVKVGGNPNILHPQCERSIKIPVFKQQQVHNTGTTRGQKMGKEGENWGEMGENFARRANLLFEVGVVAFVPRP